MQRYLGLSLRLKHLPLLTTTPLVVHPREFSFTLCQNRHETDIDFLALEATWKEKSVYRDIHSARDSSLSHDLSPFEPFYLRDIRKPTTILELLKWHYGKADLGYENQKCAIFDTILKSLPPVNTTLDGYIQSFGADVVRISLVFRDPAGGELHKEELQETQKWLESVWKAILLAHESYSASQSRSDHSAFVDGIEIEIDRLIDEAAEEHLVWVQVPPEEPTRPTSSADSEEHKLWYTTQEAILAYTAPSIYRNGHSFMRHRLVRLTKDIRNYGEEDSMSYICCEMHYHAARVLLCLMAPFAPAFAEESWVVLHYGHEWQTMDQSQADQGYDEESVQKIIEEIEDKLEQYGLPRQGRPDTLHSVFDQPFPKLMI